MVHEEEVNPNNEEEMNPNEEEEEEEQAKTDGESNVVDFAPLRPRRRVAMPKYRARIVLTPEVSPAPPYRSLLSPPNYDAPTGLTRVEDDEPPPANAEIPYALPVEEVADEAAKRNKEVVDDDPDESIISMEDAPNQEEVAQANDQEEELEEEQEEEQEDEEIMDTPPKVKNPPSKTKKVKSSKSKSKSKSRKPSSNSSQFADAEEERAAEVEIDAGHKEAPSTKTPSKTPPSRKQHQQPKSTPLTKKASPKTSTKRKRSSASSTSSRKKRKIDQQASSEEQVIITSPSLSTPEEARDLSSPPQPLASPLPQPVSILTTTTSILPNAPDPSVEDSPFPAPLLRSQASRKSRSSVPLSPPPLQPSPNPPIFSCC